MDLTGSTTPFPGRRWSRRSRASSRTLSSPTLCRRRRTPRACLSGCPCCPCTSSCPDTLRKKFCPILYYFVNSFIIYFFMLKLMNVLFSLAKLHISLSSYRTVYIHIQYSTRVPHKIEKEELYSIIQSIYYLKSPNLVKSFSVQSEQLQFGDRFRLL